ncbi:hypothetical protein B7P43_G18194 [Cryptotermes secundus]|uniref:DDE-1 domain-containing protein n=1 Tax=Cryptotermes secundus TaxID=105785 RepID=A0A2J7QZY9_9NEOP|nr:uncharacterized protein LOC111864239 [Cryptotermes secundus]PNF34161.1 hypothetical protein B7P43_G18194 [Cryptotermes secundus]
MWASLISRQSPIVSQRSQKRKKTVCKETSGERGQTVTAVFCIFVPPAMIFARKRMKPELFTDAPEGTLPMISDTGFINTELFVEWLKHFSSFVKPMKEDPVLLILDNHIAHCSIEAVLFCTEHHITLLSLPPHASGRLQPLCVGFLGPLKEVYAQEADRWLVNNPGAATAEINVGRILRSAYERVANMKIAVRACETTGIHPVNRNVFSDEDFAPSEVTFCPRVQETQATAEDTHVSANNENGNEVSLTVQPAIVEEPQVSPAMMSPLPKAVQTKKRKMTAKSPRFYLPLHTRTLF